jgi:hypothetical protein
VAIHFRKAEFMPWNQLSNPAIDLEALDRALEAVAVPPLPRAAPRVLQMLRADDCAPADLPRW